MQTLSEILATNHFPLALAAGHLTGAGADFLAREANAASFFLMGEDHGIRDNLQFATALFKLIQPAGYNAYVTEIGPVSAQHIQRALQQPNSLEALRAFYTQYPFAIPFDWFEEEIALLQTVVATHLQNPIIGIDQEFILSAQLHLASLHAWCTEPGVRAPLAEWLALEQQAIRELCAGKPLDQLALFTNQPLPAAWPLVREYFAAQQHPEALFVFDALTASNTIYRHYETQAYYLNNFSRARLMKQYFSAAYRAHRAAQPEAKFFVKLGANHVERGHSAMEVTDIGNFIAELAILENTEAFNLFVVPVGGKQNVWLPFLPPEYKAAAIDAPAPAFAPLLEAAPDTQGWHLYDLRPLRARRNVWSQDNAAFKKLILGYDAVLLMHDPHAAHLVV